MKISKENKPVKAGKKRVPDRYYPSGRVLHIACNVRDGDGNILLTKEKIDKALKDHSGSWSSYAYILHDKDVYDGEGVERINDVRERIFLEVYEDLAKESGLPKDETSKYKYKEDGNTIAEAWDKVNELCPEAKVNDMKHPHYHIILRFTQSRNIGEVARWFGIQPNFVEIKKGRGAHESALDYLVHLHDKTKYQYSPEEVYASFDYIRDLEERIIIDEQHEKYHLTTDEINDVLQDVTKNGLTLMEARERISEAVFIRNSRYFDKARDLYIKNYMPMPSMREVYYIDSPINGDMSIGKGGVGKTLCTRALAKQFAKEYGADINKEYYELRDYIYDAGDAKVAIQSYDAQPILVLNEMKGSDMLTAFGGIDGVKELLDPFPEKQEKNIKYGSKIVMAKYIIINGIQPYKKFREELVAAETGAAEQIDRRVWGWIHILSEDIMQIVLNRGIFEGTSEYRSYLEIAKLRMNWKNLSQKVGGSARQQVETKVLEPLVSKAQEYEVNMKEKITDPDMLPAEILSYGEPITEEDNKRLKVYGKIMKELGILKSKDYEGVYRFPIWNDEEEIRTAKEYYPELVKEYEYEYKKHNYGYGDY